MRTTAKLRFARWALTCVALAVASNAIFAQSYPSKPIHFLMPSSPGGGKTEIMMKALDMWKEIGLPEFEIPKRTQLRIDRA